MTNQIQIENIGPIKALSIPIEPGIVELRGFNGAGKSQALRAVGALLGDEDRLEPRRGALSNSFATGLGVTMALGKRTRTSGELTVAHLEGNDLALLIDPQIDDPARADKRRIEELCRLADVKAAFEHFAGGPFTQEEMHALASSKTLSLAGGPLPDFVASLKRDIEERARRYEEDAKALLSRSAGIREAAGVAPEGEVVKPRSHWVQMRSEAQTQIALFDQGIASWKQSAARAERAREALAQTEEPDYDPTAKPIDEQAKEAQEQYDAICQGIALREQEIRELKQMANQRVEVLKRLKEQVEHEKKRAILRQSAQQTLDAHALLVDLATLEEGKAAQQELVNTASAGERSAILREERERQIATADALKADGDLQARNGNLMRKAAAECEGVLSKAIAKIAPRGLFVEGGRLCFSQEGNTEGVFFHDLSDGERAHIALDVGADAVGEGGVLVLGQRYYEGLQPARRMKVHEHAKARKVTIVTAACDDGELRAEPFGGAP